jgi:hypothetical protein
MNALKEVAVRGETRSIHPALPRPLTKLPDESPSGDVLATVVKRPSLADGVIFKFHDLKNFHLHSPIRQTRQRWNANPP